jgi:uncharacterized damage-inducible protein DinB
VSEEKTKLDFGGYMSIGQDLLPEFDQEMASTRRELERIPEDKFSWKPHEKSMSVGRLSGHIAEIPAWTAMTIQTDSLDVAPVDGPAYRPPDHNTRAEILETFDKNVAEGRQSLAAVPDDVLHRDWSLLAGGQTIFTIPKLACIRTWVLNHIIHHRAQLGVYLRLNNIPVPAIYGPSADEGGM